MMIPPPPPVAEVMEKLQTLIVPAMAGGAFGVALLLALSRRLAWPAAAFAAVGGAALANWGHSYFAWELGDRSFQGIAPAALMLAVIGVITEPLSLLKWRPQTIVVLMWMVRIAATIYLAGWVAAQWPDRLALAGVVSLHWAILDVVAQPNSERIGNRSAQVLLLQSLALLLAGGVVLYAHSMRLSDFLNLAGAAAFGVTLAGYATKCDVRGALPIGAIVLPSVLFVTRETTTSLVPLSANALAVAAPLGLLPWVFPALARRDGWTGATLRFAVVIVLAASAVILAGRVEMLPWEEEW